MVSPAAKSTAAASFIAVSSLLAAPNLASGASIPATGTLAAAISALRAPLAGEGLTEVQEKSTSGTAKGTATFLFSKGLHVTPLTASKGSLANYVVLA